jgi:hypothetical protein
MTLDRWIQVGDCYEWFGTAEGIEVEEIWIDEDGNTQINGRNHFDERISLAKEDLIEPIEDGELKLVDPIPA